MWLLEHRIDDVAILVKYWSVYKTRQTFCPEIEKVDGEVWSDIWD